MKRDELALESLYEMKRRVLERVMGEKDVDEEEEAIWCVEDEQSSVEPPTVTRGCHTLSPECAPEPAPEPAPEHVHLRRCVRGYVSPDSLKAWLSRGCCGRSDRGCPCAGRCLGQQPA